MNFLITPGYRQCTQFFVWVKDRSITNRLADKLEQLGRDWRVSETQRTGRWVNPNMPEAGLLVVWYDGEDLHPQQLHNKLKGALMLALQEAGEQDSEE